MPRYRIIKGRTPVALSQLADNSCAAVIADPPYSSGSVHSALKAMPTHCKYGKDMNRLPDFVGDSMGDLAFLAFTSWWLWECLRIVGNGIIFCFIDDKVLPVMQRAFQIGDVRFKNFLIWNKNNGRVMKNGYRRDVEFILNGHFGRPLFDDAPFYKRTCVLKHAPVSPKKKRHQTEKPISLLLELIEGLPKNDKRPILDPFAGSGSLGEAAVKSRHDVIMVEAMSTYCDVIKSRMKQLPCIESQTLGRGRRTAKVAAS